MPLQAGDRLGPYRIVDPLGAGGMGEVYRATDSKLRRDVAIKVLPEAFTADADRLARFEREAQALAQLQHPNIASIYGYEESEGLLALVMELVDGAGLDRRIADGALDLDESLAIAHQIAEALEAAHEKGIVHRDLKPQNVKITPDGTVKVLDFGLAKAMDPAGAASGPDSASQLAASPTLTLGATVQGMILGTAGYMAPEQAKGRAVVDKRADIWAFGVVLWEMLTGRRLFEGDSVPETLAGVLKSTIDLAALPPHIPPAIRRLLRRCLERNPKNRLHDIADARIVLDEVASGRSGEAPATAPEPQTRKLLVSSLVAVALLVGLAVGGFFGRGTAPKATPLPSPSHTELEIVAPPNTLLVSGLSISPDGRRLAFVARGEDGRTALWVRPLDEPAAAMLPGTTDARYPFWAPDSKRIGFFAQSRLKVTDLLGGSPRTLAETGATTDARGGTWGADDRIVYAPTFVGSLFSVPVEGGAPGPATRLPEGSDMNTQRFPSFLPDGRRFVFYSSVGTGTEPGEIFLGRLGSPEVKRLGPATSAAVWAPPGYLLFVQGHELVARRFDEVREELDGDPIPLGISLPGSISVSGQRSLSASNQGTLVYRTDKRSATRLVWVDRAGEELATVSSEPDVWHYAPSLSPDGRRVAVSHYEPGSTSGAIWVHDLERGSAYPLTFGDNGDDTLPTWSPDAEEVAFASVRANAPSGIFRSRVGQPGHEEPWLESASYVSPLAWLPSGRGLLYQGADAKGGYSLWRWDGDDGEPTRLSPEGGYETGAVPSPDGAWIAFGSEATRRMEIYLRRLDDTDGSSTLRVSTEGGSFPRWRGDGRELFYLDGNGRIMAVAVEPGEPPQCGPPQPLFQARLEEAGDPQYDVTADGQRFLLNRTLMEDRVPVAVVQGWTARLGKRRTP